MEPIIRGLIVYLFLLLVFRLAGKRTLSEATAFDLVLLLIISETTQQAMVDNDHSMTNGALLILTLVTADVVFSLVKHWFPVLDPILDGSAIILIRDGKVFKERLDRERIDMNDILEAARQQLGLENLDQIKLAVLERGGDISIVPK